jgi:YebC/PmpR family DNA-binding regulatory protein
MTTRVGHGVPLTRLSVDAKIPENSVFRGVVMAGHSKWANIQHRKKAQDAKRGKIFTKLIREITVAARSGDPDPAANPRLRLAVDKALAANMSKDTIERAIKRGAGAQEGDNFEEIRYEGYGPGGVAVMVDCMTDNRNRTVSEVRHAFTKAGGNLGTSGSVAFQFKQTGVLSYAVGSDEDAIMEAALEAGATDVVTNDDGSVDVLTEADDFVSVRDAMSKAGFRTDEAEVTMRAENTTPLDKNDAEKMIRLLDRLEDLDDVQNVYSNADIAAEILEEL